MYVRAEATDFGFLVFLSVVGRDDFCAASTSRSVSIIRVEATGFGALF